MSSVLDAIILTGGKGTRLASIISDVPKPMAPIMGRPFISYLLDYLCKSNLIKRTFFAAGYKADKIVGYYGSHYRNMPIEYSIENEPLGTGGAVIKLLNDSDITDPFLIFNGDSFIDANLSRLIEVFDPLQSKLVINLTHVENTSRYGSVFRNGNVVSGFDEKTGSPEEGVINSGVYLASHDAFNNWMSQPGFISLEQTILPHLVKEHEVTCIESGSKFIDIGTPETYASADTFFG